MSRINNRGGWKIAYSDFMTAMMAIFLILWLISNTSNQQRRGVSNYFSGSKLFKELNLATEDADGVPTNSHKALRPLEAINLHSFTFGDKTNLAYSIPELDRKIDEMEKLLLEKFHINANLFHSQNEYVHITQVKEGLLIEILDNTEHPIFGSGNAIITPYGERLITDIIDIIRSIPCKIMLYGHVDSSDFSLDNGYNNWNLSLDRAGSLSKIICKTGIKPDRIYSITGLSNNKPFTPYQPSHPSNRRVSILLLRSHIYKLDQT